MSTEDSKIEARTYSKNLSSEEAFLYSRLSTSMTVSELIQISPWPKDKTQKLLHSLIDKGAAAYHSSTPLQDDLENQLDREDQDEQLKELPRGFRRRVRLENQEPKDPQQAPYEVLKLRRTASFHEIKQKYFELSREFHPDRFFRKPLGPYKKELEKLFTRIQKAYATLKDPHQKEFIDRRLNRQSKESNPTQTQSHKKKMDPELERLGRAETYFQQGLKAEKARNYDKAAKNYFLAKQTEPKREKYRKAYEAIKQLMGE